MVNLPDSLYEDYSKLKLTSSSYAASSSSAPPPPPPTVVTRSDFEIIYQWIYDLHHPHKSEYALQNLANHRNNFEFLPSLLWESNGIVTMMLQEITGAYRHMVGHISLPFLPRLKPLRVYNVLLLFQSIAYHPDTRGQFLRAKMPNYFYPLMDIGLTDKPHECIRLGALGVVAHLLKAPQEGAIRYLMDSGALGYCVKPVEFGSTDSKTLALFILHKILSTDEGLHYCCVLVDRFYVIDDLLKKVLVYLSNKAKPSTVLFNLVVGCYAKLSQKPRARDGLRHFPPVSLFDGTFARLLAEDPVADNYQKQLIKNLENVRNEVPETLFSRKN